MAPLACSSSSSGCRFATIFGLHPRRPAPAERRAFLLPGSPSRRTAPDGLATSRCSPASRGRPTALPNAPRPCGCCPSPLIAAPQRAASSPAPRHRIRLVGRQRRRDQPRTTSSPAAGITAPGVEFSPDRGRPTAQFCTAVHFHDNQSNSTLATRPAPARMGNAHPTSVTL